MQRKDAKGGFVMKKNMQQISEFIDNKAKKQRIKISNLDKFLKAQKNLKRYATKTEKSFTFTVGDVNAYLG